MALCGPSGHNQQGPFGLLIVLVGYWALGFFLVFPRMDNDVACATFRVLLSIFGVGVLINLIGVHVADPGIIPVGEWTAETAAVLRGPIAGQFRKVVDPVTNEEWEQKFCSHCLIWRPDRAAHCYTCDRCVARYDHHCPVLGACIAQRTYRFFLGVLFFASIGGLLLFIGSIWWLVALHPNHHEVWNHWPPYIACLSLISTLYLGGVTGFLGMHCFLLCQQKTTKEQFGRAGSRRRRCCLTSGEAWREFCNIVICAPVSKRTIWGQSLTKIVQTTPMISHSISSLIVTPPEVKVMNADGTPMVAALGVPPPVPPTGPYATATSGPVRSVGIHEYVPPVPSSPTPQQASISLNVLPATATGTATSPVVGSVVPPPVASSTQPTPSASLITIPAPPAPPAASNKHHGGDDEGDEDAESRPLSPRIWAERNQSNTNSNNNSGVSIHITPLLSSTQPSSTIGSGSSGSQYASSDTQHEPLLSQVGRVSTSADSV